MEIIKGSKRLKREFSTTATKTIPESDVKGENSFEQKGLEKEKTRFVGLFVFNVIPQSSLHDLGNPERLTKGIKASKWFLKKQFGVICTHCN